MNRYLALIDRDAGSDFGVSFPDFPGCITAGATFEEACDMATEALALHLEGMSEDGDAVPESSSLDDIASHHNFQDGAAIWVEAAAVA